MDRERLEKVAAAAPKASGGVRRKAKSKHSSSSHTAAKASANAQASSGGATPGRGGGGSQQAAQRQQQQGSNTFVQEEKKMQNVLKRVGNTSIPSVEQVNIFQGDYVLQFNSPKVQANMNANTYAISGSYTYKHLQEVLPSLTSSSTTTTTAPTPADDDLPAVDTFQQAHHSSHGHSSSQG